MTAQIAGYARRRYTQSALARRMLITLNVVVAVVVVVGIGYVVLKVNDNGPAPFPPATPLSFSAKQDVDVHLVAGAVGQYVSDTSALPTHLSSTSSGELVLCASSCDPSLYELGGFSVYQAANIKMVNYTPGLAAPNQSTMYLVPNAKCGKDGTLGDQNPVPRSVVILYASGTGGGTTPRCIVL